MLRENSVLKTRKETRKQTRRKGEGGAIDSPTHRRPSDPTLREPDQPVERQKR